MTRSMLSPKGKFLLTKLVQEEYAAHAVNDGEFAKYATSTLGCAVNANHVWGVRTAFDIPATKPRGKVRLSYAALEKRVKALEDRLDIYMQGGRR